jgi:hypothetical protein
LREQFDYNLLIERLVRLSIDERICDHSSLSNNRDRLIEAKVTRKLSGSMVLQASKAAPRSNEHFGVDGSLIESWGVKGMRRRDSADGQPQDPND